MFSREPILWIQTLQTIVIGFLPVAMIFNLLDWSVEQFGVIEAFIVLVAGAVSGLFARSQVTPWPVVPEDLSPTHAAELKAAVQ